MDLNRDNGVPIAHHGVHCAVSAKYVIEPIWFEDQEFGEAVCVNQEQYREANYKLNEILKEREYV